MYQPRRNVGTVQGFAPQRNTEFKDAMGVSPWSFTL